MCAGRNSPVSGLITATVSPAKSTNSLSPAACVWRIVADAAAPRVVEIAEPAVPVTIRMLRAILLPQQHQRHAAPLEFLMQFRPIGSRAIRLRLASGCEQPALKLTIIEQLWQRPGE